MKERYLPIIVMLLILLAAVLLYFLRTETSIVSGHKYDKLCNEFAVDNGIKSDWSEAFKGDDIKFFYSERLDTCVASVTNELKNEYMISDIQRNFIKKPLGDITTGAAVFYCDKDGIDNTILERVELYEGEIFMVPYDKFLDDGEGGKPRTIQAPDKPYTREQCKSYYDKKLIEIR